MLSARARRGAQLRLLALAALLAGLAATLWLALRQQPEPGEGALQRAFLAGYLFDGHTFGQELKLTRENLFALRLWLPRPVHPAGTVRLRLEDGETDATLVTVTRPAAELSDTGPTTFDLPPIPPDPMHPFLPLKMRLVLETDGVDRAAAVSVMAGEDDYANGALLRDGGRVRQADLAFEPLYQATAMDRFVPITRIAYGRPGILGWPPLYALAGYGLLAGCALALIRLLAPGDERGAAATAEAPGRA